MVGLVCMPACRSGGCLWDPAERLWYAPRVDADIFDEGEFFGALARSGGRILLIGRRALIALGLPMVTADYDLWVHIDDIELLNRAAEPFDFVPSLPPEQARRRGRYVLEDGEHVDVLVARSQTTQAGARLAFDDAWSRRQSVRAGSAVTVTIPAIDDLILTKQWAMRDKDIADIRFLEGLKQRGKP